jgi:protein-tyrosine phosphatase
MVDLHSHIIPRLDDGARTLEDSVEMCRLAAADGIDTMVATPHRFNGVHPDPPVDELRNRFHEVQQAVGNSVRLVLGCELHFTHQIVEQVCESGEAVPINGGPYLLIEFPHPAIPAGCEKPLYALMSAGFRPIIAHPERNFEVQNRPDRYYNLSELGLLSQVDAGSLLGKFGKKAEATARLLVECNLVHAVSSDTHSPRHRRPGLSAARAHVTTLAGAETAHALFDANPRAIVDGAPIPHRPEPLVPGVARKRFRFF